MDAFGSPPPHPHDLTMATGSAIYTQMEAKSLLAAPRYKGWQFLTTLRPVIAILLVALMAGNAIAGSFSGIVHSHAVEDGGLHHLHDSSYHHHDHNGGARPAADMNGDGASNADASGDQGKLHEHGPIIALGLTSTPAFNVPASRATWALPSPDSLVLDRRLAFDRPPRAA